MKKKKFSLRILSLVLSLLLLITAVPVAGILSVSAADDLGIYLKGSMNGWGANEDYRFIHEGDGRYSLVVNMDGGNYVYKIMTGEGYGVVIPSGPNAELDLDKDTTLKFDVDINTGKYTYVALDTKSDFILGNSKVTIEAEKYTYALGKVNVWPANEASGGNYVGAFDEGDSINYGVTVEGTEPKTYRFEISVASESDDGIFDFITRTETIVGTESFYANFSKTGGWQNYKTVVVTRTLQPGYNRITLDNIIGTYNVDKIVVTPADAAETLTKGTTNLNFAKFDGASDAALIKDGVFTAKSDYDYASVIVKPEQDGVYKVSLDGDASVVIGDNLYEINSENPYEYIAIEGETEFVVIAEKAGTKISKLDFEYINNVELMGHFIYDDVTDLTGYRFKNVYDVNKIIISSETEISAGKLILSNGKEIQVEAIKEGDGDKVINFDTPEKITWFVYEAESAVFANLQVIGTKDMTSPDDIALDGYVSTADGWLRAYDMPYSTTVAQKGKVGFGFDNEVSVSKVVVIAPDDTLPAKATLTAAGGKSVELTGTKKGNTVEFTVDNLYSFGFEVDFGKEVTYSAVQVYGSPKYNGGITDESDKLDYALYINGITENDSRVVANTGTHILTSESGADRIWDYDPALVGEAPVFYAPNTPLAEAAYNLTMEEIFGSIYVDGDNGDVFNTGASWGKVWTRDTAMSTQFILSWLFPEISTNCAYAKVVGKDGNLTFEEDTGTGGSYPVSTDRIIMMLSVWETYLADGNKETLEYFYNVASNTIEQDLEVVYDKEAGLFRGETCGLDHRDKTYNDWTNEELSGNGLSTIAEGKAASTNIIYCQVMKILSESAEILGKDEKESKAWADLAADLEKAISERLWHEDLGTYASWEYPDWMGSPLPYKQDVIADGYAVWYNIGGQEKSDSIMENHTLVPFGANTVYPQKNAARWTDYKYHDSGVWPGWEAILMIGAVNNKNENNLLAEEIWNSSLRGAVACLTNYEVIDYETGQGLHSKSQLWSIACTMAGYYRVLFGMEYTTDGITFDPYVPQWMEGPFYLGGLKYRNADVSIELQGKGDTVKEIYVNDEKVANDYVLPADAEGDYMITIVLSDSGEEDKINLKEENTAKAPNAPNATLSGTTLQWNSVQNCTYKVWTGTEYVDVEGTSYVIADDTYGVYSVIAVDKTTGLWSELSKPVTYNPAGSKITANVGDTNNTATFTVNIPVDGEYQLSAIYTNDGDATSSSKAAIRSVYVDGKDVATMVFPAMKLGHQLSTHSRIALTAGKHEITVKYATENWYDRNMSNAYGGNENNVTFHMFSLELQNGDFSKIEAPTGKTVFFTNNKNWSDVSIFFWGGADSTNWPGVPMEFAYTNENGEDVYKYTLDPSTPNIIFNNGNNNQQTVDIKENVEDYKGFYLTNSYQSEGKTMWNVETWDVPKPSEPETEPTEPSTGEVEPSTSATEPSTGETEPAETKGTEPASSEVPVETTKATEPASSEIPTGTTETEPSTSVGTTVSYLVGDADLNNKVNVKDVTAIQKHTAKIITLIGNSIYTSDVNEDEIINIKDATVIQKYLAKFKVDFPVGKVVEKEVYI
ncbi:MAG: starch-binding protein [Clostridia bacterium]|nr:starch-binding protein [Clostridia bacterium]